MSNKEYWKEMNFSAGFYCPNSTLFRFIADESIPLKELKVLEVGFGANRGIDLLEFKKRGSECHGIDINSEFVNGFLESNTSVTAHILDIGNHQYPYKKMFGLVYSTDTIYYLDNEEIKFHFKESARVLNKDGYFLVQFIEQDLIDRNQIMVGRKIDFSAFNEMEEKHFFEKINPIRLLDPELLIDIGLQCELTLKGSKCLIESHGQLENKFRLNRYLMFKK